MNETNIQKKKFKEYKLDNQIKRALSELGFMYPLEVQEKTFPLIMDKKDLVVQSQTGSGKTAAFAIPICEQIDIENTETQALILAPTRELALQVKEDIDDIGRYKGIKTLCIVGKEALPKQKKALREGAHIIVATPGRMIDHLTRRNIKLKYLEFFVIDEADEMFIMGFQEQIEDIIKHLPEERNTLLFSATMPTKVLFLSQQHMVKPEQIEIEAEVSTIDKIHQIHYAVDGLKKVDYMKRMLQMEQPQKAMIFCNTREQVDKVFDIMRKWKMSVTAIHGGLDQHVRTNRMRAFKRGEFRILIATDMASRGLHIRGLTHVINYSVPFEHENYVHRIGRTGRVDENGIAITLVIPKEMDRFEDLQKFLEYEIPCKGGHVTRQPRTNNKNRKNPENDRYKSGSKHKKTTKLQINSGKMNGNLSKRDILNAISNLPGLSKDDVGAVEMRDKFTNVEIFNDKDKIVIKAFREMKLKGKRYHAKKMGKR